MARSLVRAWHHQRAMSDHFDPYYTWLGIPPEEQPADFYRLLGVRQFEADEEVILNASDQRMAYLRTFQVGKRSKESQALLNEISEAQGCLLDPKKKQAYDAELRRWLAATQPASSSPVTRQTSPLPQAQAMPGPLAPVPVSGAPSPAAQLTAARAALARPLPVLVQPAANTSSGVSPLDSLGGLQFSGKQLRPAVRPRQGLPLPAPLFIGAGMLAAGFVFLLALTVWIFNRPTAAPVVANVSEVPAGRPSAPAINIPGPPAPPPPVVTQSPEPDPVAASPPVAIVPEPASPPPDSGRSVPAPVIAPAIAVASPMNAATQQSVPLEAIKLQPPGVLMGGKQMIIGWQFKTKVPIWVKHLGVFDAKSEGLSNPHEVAIWNINDQTAPCVQETIPAGVESPLIGLFRTVPVKHLKLEAGETFAIVAYYPDHADMRANHMNAGLHYEIAEQLSIEGGYQVFYQPKLVYPRVVEPGAREIQIGPSFCFVTAP